MKIFKKIFHSNFNQHCFHSVINNFRAHIFLSFILKRLLVYSFYIVVENANN